MGNAMLHDTVVHGGTRTVLARVMTWGAEADVPIVQADITAITYSIWDATEAEWSEVAGHQDQPVTVADAVFNTPQVDSRWTKDATGYNFRHTPPVGATPPFPEPDRDYRLYYTFTPADGEPFVVGVGMRSI
jgi:hypothetical protein